MGDERYRIVNDYDGADAAGTGAAVKIGSLGAVIAFQK